MRRKHLMLVALLLMGVGFASVSTTLVMDGNVKIATNVEDFDVRFTKAILDGNNISSSTISVDGKTIKYEANNLSAVGNTSMLNFEVTNYSEMYDAKVSVSCTAEVNNNYYKITSSEEIEIAGKAIGTGNVVVELLESSVGNETFTCTLNAMAIERATKAEEILPLKYIPKYFEFGEPTTIGTQDYRTLKYPNTDTLAKVFIGLDADGVQKSVCTLYTGSLECFKNNNWEKEKSHIQRVFNDIECDTSDSFNVVCVAKDFSCHVDFYGNVNCNNYVDDANCNLSSGGTVSCGDLSFLQ